MIGQPVFEKERRGSAGALSPPPWAWGLLLALLPLALLLGVWAGQRDRTPTEGSPEVVFARDMAAHHEQAVEMALILRERSADEALRPLLLDIALSQQGQIGQMQGWLAAWGVPLAGAAAPMAGHGDSMGMASQTEVNQLVSLPLAEAEIAFLQLMIRHHRGGVAMAEDVLAQSSRPEVVRLAQAILNAQSSEITYMETLLAARGVAPPAPTEMPEHDH